MRSLRPLSYARVLRRHHVVQRTPQQNFRARTDPIRSTVNGGTRPLISIMDANLITALAGGVGVKKASSGACPKRNHRFRVPFLAQFSFK